MKAHLLTAHDLFLIMIIPFALLTFSPVIAEEDEDEDEEIVLTNAETIELCKKHIPIAIQLMERVREEEGEEEYQNTLRLANEMACDYLHILKHDGNEAA